MDWSHPVFDGAVSGELSVGMFLAYVEQVLVRTLRPDDIVIMAILARV
jgi:hypothetical protein